MDSTSVQNREPILAIERLVAAGPQVECPVRHHFACGVYVREMFIPKGTILVGKIHREETVNICSMGDISVLTEKGLMRFRAPAIVVSAPGIKKVGYTHEDTVWINIHPTEETDLEKIEARFIAKSYDELELMQAMKELELL